MDCEFDLGFLLDVVRTTYYSNEYCHTKVTRAGLFLELISATVGSNGSVEDGDLVIDWRVCRWMSGDGSQRA
jgi:hypothetical protein